MNSFVSIDFLEMLIKFAICLSVNFVIIDRLYYPKSKRRDFYFTYMLTSVAVFFLMFFMMGMKAKASMGIGIGLFGIFSIMRFRTDTMPVREMTYLFLIISLSVVSAIIPTEDDNTNFEYKRLVELIITNIIVIAITWLCENRLKVKSTKLIQYDRVELAKPEHYEELIEDLKKRTGLDIVKVDIGGIDFLRDSVVLKVYYNPSLSETSNSVKDKFKLSGRDMRE